jgi:hypothetical protein
LSNVTYILPLTFSTYGNTEVSITVGKKSGSDFTALKDGSEIDISETLNAGGTKYLKWKVASILDNTNGDFNTIRVAYKFKNTTGVASTSKISDVLRLGKISVLKANGLDKYSA